MHCELSAEDDKPSPHLLEIQVSHNFLVTVYGFKGILGKLNTLNTKMQTSGVTYGTVKALVNATIAGLKRDFFTNSGRVQQETLLC